MKENKTFLAIDDEENEIECEVMMSYHCLDNNINYIFYTDNQNDEEGNLNFYASRYWGEDENGMILEEITDDNEWDLLEDAFLEAKKGLNN